jgi:hypothetical protein
MDLSDPDFQRISQRHARAVHDAIEAVLTAAAAGGQVVLNHPVSHLAQLVHVVYNGALVTWGMDPQGSAHDAVANALTTVVTSSTMTGGG